MSNGVLVNALAREMGREFSAEQVAALQAGHARVFRELAPHVRPLPGAVELLRDLSQRGVPWAVATSGTRATAAPNFAKLGVPPSVPVVTRDEVPFAKPDPDLFLAAAQRRWEWGSCRAATAARSSRWPAPSASTMTLPHSGSISMSWEFGGEVPTSVNVGCAPMIAQRDSARRSEREAGQFLRMKGGHARLAQCWGMMLEGYPPYVASQAGT